MNALVIGCGSIGRRHIKNLVQSARVKSISVLTNNPQCLEGLPQSRNIRLVDTLEHVSADFAVVSNDTCRHLETAMVLAQRRIDMFIEKPVSHNMKGVEEFSRLVKDNHVKLFIGYNMRLLGAMSYLREKLSKGYLGKLYFVDIEVGQYLPYWRKTGDYRMSYSASRVQGGGVALDLSHEIDYMKYLFGFPDKWIAMRGKVGQLEMDAEDIFEGIYHYNNFLCRVHMDCLQKTPTRRIRIVGSEGSLLCDFLLKKIDLIADRCREELTDASMFDFSRTYKDEMDHFLDVVTGDSEPYISLSDGIDVLRLIRDGNE